MRSALILGGLALVLIVGNAAVVERERVLASGTPVLLELAPVDPRSLIQGDYMRLDYVLARQLPDSQPRWPRIGEIVIALNEHGVARFVRRHDGRSPLGQGEHLLTYRRKRGSIQVGTDAFHFQEGDAPTYTGARYGELRVARSGTSVLVGLRDSARAVLRPPAR